jgi:hypothetical protein
MTHDPSNAGRRAMLVAAAGLISTKAAGGSLATQTGARAAGKAGDFEFLSGQWKIRHRRLKGKEWDEFDGEATCWTVLGGAGSIEELRIPARNFSGLGIRLLDPKSGVWNDHWVNGQAREIGEAGLTGVFVDGVGTFTAQDTDNGAPIVVRGVWDRITPASCRWRQGVSRDGGKTWEENWFMEWRRA